MKLPVKLKTEKQMVILPGATDLFEERGKLEEVADLACSWFSKYLTKAQDEKT